MPAIIRLRQWFLKPALLLIERVPSAVFSRWVQAALDGSFAMLSLFLAYQLRFDSVVPADVRRVMYTWIIVVAVLRPALMAAVRVYQLTWRYFAFNDAMHVGLGAILTTAILLVFRLTLYRVPLMANPISVILMDAAIFVLLASGARAFRRLVAEESMFVTGERKRVLLVGSETVLSAALRQISEYRNLQVVGCLVPGCKKNLQGVRIGGCPVLGDTADLNPRLRQLKADLVMITDASLDSIGDVVSIATHHGTEVRLLPSAANVMRDEVAISAVRRPSNWMERVLVLGGAGYVGSTLVPMLLARGYKVRVLDRLLFGAEPLAGLDSENFELMVGDVRDIQVVVGAIKGCDAVIDLAAIVGDPACAVNKQLSLEVNRAATRMLIDIAKGYGVGRLVFASTCSVYGASDYLVDELTPPAPISVYAETKVASEQLLMESACRDFHPVILRLGTLFGLSPRPRFDLVVNLLTARAAALGKITVYNGEQWRPFLHVHDAARAFVTAMEAAPEREVFGNVFNVGDYSLNLRLAQVSQKIAEMVPTVTIEHLENGDKRNYRASFDKIHTRLGFKCEKSLDFGIREIYCAIESGQIRDFTASQFNNQMVTQVFAQGDGAAQSSMRLLARLAA